MHYFAHFKDIQMVPYSLEIWTEEGGLSDYELTLADDPVIISTSSSGLFSPIKSMSCTVNIKSDGGLFDLYTIDPQKVKVLVTNMTNAEILFRGYATPCQYGQDWTTIDTLSLECVDLISSLKDIPYSVINGKYKSYVQIDRLICYILSMVEPPEEDQLYHVLSWYWPKYNFQTANTYSFDTTYEMLHAIKLNEANFFDDDDEETPWSCYEILEEICKYFNVSLVPFKGSYYFIDYQAIAATTPANATFWRYTLDLDVDSSEKSKNMTLDNINYAGGTSSIETDDLYNKISVDANRYDLDEIATDLYDEDYHISITKKYDFGGDAQTWTITSTNFWGTTSTIRQSWIFTQYCILKHESGWRHTWWSPRSMVEYYGNDCYSTAMAGYSDYLSLPENKYINTIGATILHYATIDALNQKPTKLDWNSVIMFNCLTDTIKPSSTNTEGKLKVKDIATCYDGNTTTQVVGTTFEKPVLTYESDYEMNYSPKDGISWIVLNGKLWYQQNIDTGNNNMFHNGNKHSSSLPTGPKWEHDIMITDWIKYTNKMFPIEDATDVSGYYCQISADGSPSTTLQIMHQQGHPNYGWNLMKFKVQIGDKYWDGKEWTTTDSTFYVRFTCDIANTDSGDPTDSFGYLKWMNIITNTTYQDKVGTDGYAIPIRPDDCVCGKIKLTLYTPRMFPTNYLLNNTYRDLVLDWFERGPIVYMKDFKVDYVYTDETEWWLYQDDNREDVKYSNDVTKQRYVYEKEIACKINSWQEGNPIAKSFPIINFTNGNQEVCEYLGTIKDPSWYNYSQAQEYNIISRQLRHYSQPRKIFNCYRKNLMNPWMKIQMNDALEIDGIFVVDKQEYSVRNRNNNVTLIEYGDNTTYSS